MINILRSLSVLRVGRGGGATREGGRGENGKGRREVKEGQYVVRRVCIYFVCVCVCVCGGGSLCAWVLCWFMCVYTLCRGM